MLPAHPPRLALRPKLESSIIRFRRPGNTNSVSLTSPLSLPPQIIEKNTRIRLKIVGTRVDATEIVRILAPCVILHIDCTLSLRLERSKKII